MSKTALIELEVFCSVCSSQLNVSEVKDNFILIDNCRTCRQDRFEQGVSRGFDKFKEEVNKEKEEEAVVEKKVDVDIKEEEVENAD